MRRELLAEPTLSRRLRPEAAPPVLAPLVAATLPPESAAGVDLILEGFLAHHGAARHLTPRGDDRHVLAGDFCYATGLVRVAAAGDIFVIEALAELIALSAGLVSDDRRHLLAPLWRAVIAAIVDPDRAAAEGALRAAIDALCRDGDPEPVRALAGALPDTPELEECLA